MKNNLKSIISLLLSVVILCVTAVGCTEEGKKGGATSSKGESSVSSSDNSSSESDAASSDESVSSEDNGSYPNAGDMNYGDDYDYDSEDDYEFDYGDTYEKRPLAEGKKPEYIEKFVPEFTSKNVKWDGPAGYTIVYAKGDNNAYASAKKLKEFFEKNDKVTLKLVTDEAAKGKKEILIGNTNRYKTSLSEQKFAVVLKDNKLIFEGGHYIMVRKAVDWFTTVKRVKGQVATLSGEAKDFSSRLKNGYVYVWGDEFDGYGFPDETRWDERMFMGYDDNFKPLDHDLSATCVEDGRLKMTAMRYYDPGDEKYQYANGKPLTTSSTMAYMYGYAEIRARVPFVNGAWPAWWARSTDGANSTLNPFEKSCVYDVEVDIFEVFSSEDTLYPNLHKWYQNTYKNNRVYDNDGKDITDTLLGKPKDGLFNSDYNAIIGKKGYTFEKSEDLRNEYHTYGYLWTPEKMEFSVDGKVYNTIDITKPFDGYSNDDLNQFYYFLFDNHLYTNGDSKVRGEDLPVLFYVDYIRLYQLPSLGQINIAEVK